MVTADGARQALKLLHINEHMAQLARQKRLSNAGVIEEQTGAGQGPAELATKAFGQQPAAVE